jgi:hypothetical protein
LLIYHSAHKEWQALSELGELVEPESKNREEFIKECQDGKLDGVVAAYRTFASVAVTGRFDKELCNVLPKSWKYLGICGTLKQKLSAGYAHSPLPEPRTWTVLATDSSTFSY